jgi:hypothetical protein
MKYQSLLTVSFVHLFIISANAYEVPNHSDMSARALVVSKIGAEPGTNGKLFRLGLRGLGVTDAAQFFPRAAGTALSTDAVTCWPKDNKGNRQIPADFNKLTLDQLMRYGACYEDNEAVGAYRSLGHFYNPQSAGIGLSGQPNSPDWALAGAGASSGGVVATGPNHFSYADARTAFYRAVTLPAKADRNINWGLTFQSLGHVVHHLQDMAQPQHVRNDDHCDKPLCAAQLKYAPSGYEKALASDRFVDVIQQLAQTATTPILFGLPREFWNATGTDSIINYASPTQGIAAYTGTNYVSSGRDFAYQKTGASTGQNNPNPLLALPIPTAAATETANIGALTGYSNANAPERLRLVCPDLAKCLVKFYGSTNQPNTRKSAASIFGSDFEISSTTVTGNENRFTQNFYTYAAAATDLVPKATEYSAGLINYFFRGEMAVRLPVEGVYGLIDGGDPASNCRDTCGFKKLKARLKNTTAAINGVPQDFAGGTLTAIVKYSRNSCYSADYAGDPGALFPYNPSCFVTGSEAVEEQVMADAIPAPFNLASGSEVALTLTFSTPIPVNAWNVKLQFVYRGPLGLEPDGVAVHTHALSAPTPLRYTNEYDYLLINQKLYSRADVNASQTLLTQVVPASCVIGAAGSKTLLASCFNPQTVATSWTGANGATLASLAALPTNAHALWVYLADFNGNVSVSLPAPSGAILATSLFVRDQIALDSTGQLAGDLLINWRGLQSFYVFSRYYLASADQTAAPTAISNLRPAFPTTTPVKMTSFNF